MRGMGCSIIGGVWVFFFVLAVLLLGPQTAEDWLSCFLLGGLGTGAVCFAGVAFGGIGRGNTEV